MPNQAGKGAPAAPGGFGSMRWLWLILLVLLLLSAAGSIFWRFLPAAHNARNPENDVHFGAAPQFVLTDQNGNPFSSESLKGKVWLTNFIYTRCFEECPLLTSRMKTVADLLEREKLLGGKVEILSISVDPTYDTPERLREYAQRYEIATPAWHFLTGDKDDIKNLLVKGFRVAADWGGQASVPRSLFGLGVAEAHSPDDDHGLSDITHSERVVLVDPDGIMRAYFPGLDVAPADVVRQVKALVR